MTSDDRGTDPVPDESVPRSSPLPKAERRRRGLPVWQETVLLLVVAVVLAVVLKTFFVQAFYIPSESMEPGLVENDRILVEKTSYWFGEPQRGDVVVFEDPGGWLGDDDASGPSNAFTEALAKLGLFPSGGHLVKRVIGVEGDVITCCDDEGRIAVNGEPLDESGYVITGADCEEAGRRALLLETNRPGVLAVGDVRSGSIKRVASAVGEGSMAVRLVHEHLGTLR